MHTKSCLTCFYYCDDDDLLVQGFRGECRLHKVLVTDPIYQSCVTDWLSKKRIENLDKLIK